jgi:UDP-N-acetylglucosamine 3-dehydrogenase
MGNVHANQYQKMADVEVVFHDRDAERTGIFKDRWDSKPFDSIGALIDSVDIVDVCLPTDLHLDAALRAVAAGKPVFVEKPMARTLDEARNLRDAAEKAGVPVMPGQVVRFFPEYAAGNRLVKRGAVGTPAAARTRRGGKAPGGSQGWFMDHARSGGVLVDLAIHDFDWLRWTLGEVKFLYARSVAADKGTGPDYALTTLTFESGAVAHVESTWMDPAGFRTAFEIAGSDGLIQFDSRSGPALRTARLAGDDSGDYMPGSSTGAETPQGELDDPYYLELRSFLDAVIGGTPPAVTAEDGVRALAIALAAMQSAKTRQVVVPEGG